MSTLRRYESYLDDRVYAAERGEWVHYEEAHALEVENEALWEALTALLREHDSAPDAKGSDTWDAARKLLEGK